MFVLDLFNTKYEKELKEGAVDKVVSEGGPYDLPGKDYDRPGDTPRRPRTQGDTSPRRHPDDPDFMDPDQRRLRADQARVAKANAERRAKKEQDVAEGLVKGEYGRVLDALQLYYPRLGMTELNVPGYHKVVADKANVPVEYAARVINDFARDDDPDEDEFSDFNDDEQGVAEGNGRLNEFAPSASGGSGDYFQALASAWYNGAFDTGSLEKGIKSKEDVERLLNRGIIGPDGVTRKYAIDYNSTFEGVVISSDDYYEHSDYNDQGQEVDSRNGRPWGPYDYMEFDDEELDESAKWRDPKYKGQLYTQEPPDYNDTREYDNARFNPKPKGYAGRKELPGGGEYDRTDPLRRGQGIGRSGIKNNINLSGKRKGLPSRDQITSLKGSIKDAHGTHTRPNLPEQGVAEGIVDALKGSWEKVKNFDSPARSTSNTQRYQDLRKRQELKRKQIKNQVPVNELSTDKLAQYKTAAALDAGAADKRGDYERGDKRFAGIVKATKKQFANDLKKHGQQGMAEGAPISGDGGAVDNFRQQMANNTEIAYQKGMAEAKKKKKKRSSRSLGRYFFPGYGYYGSGESGEGGGDGGGGEGESVNRAVAEGSSTASDAVERVILNRIMVRHTDLLMRFGPDKVMQAAEEVAYNVGDVDEIGTSDVSAYVNQVRQILGAR